METRALQRLFLMLLIFFTGTPHKAEAIVKKTSPCAQALSEEHINDFLTFVFGVSINNLTSAEKRKLALAFQKEFEKDPESDALDAAMNNKFGNNKLSMLILKKQIKR